MRTLYLPQDEQNKANEFQPWLMQSLLVYATGLKETDMDKAQVGISSVRLHVDPVDFLQVIWDSEGMLLTACVLCYNLPRHTFGTLGIRVTCIFLI